MGEIYDAIVLGLGGVGSAAAYHLARGGARVLGLEQHGLVHDQGSSHGHSRVIRKAYFEHPDYVPLLVRAYALWGALEREAGTRLYHPCGVLQVGPEDGVVVPGVRASAAQHGLPLEVMTPEAAAARFPGFVVPEGHTALLELDAGVLRVEAAVRAHLDAAAASGATLVPHAPVTGLAVADAQVRVSWPGGEARARHLVVCTGAFDEVLARLGLALPVRPLGKTMFWYPPAPEHALEAGCPAFLFESAHGVHYGLPAFEGEGVKVAQHHGGEVLDAPDAARRPVPPEEAAAVEAFRRRALPGSGQGVLRTSRCMYAMTPDGHFIVDRHPAHPRVQVAVGLSGHGFKLTPTLGQALAERVLRGETALPIGLFGLQRFGG